MAALVATAVAASDSVCGGQGTDTEYHILQRAIDDIYYFK